MTSEGPSWEQREIGERYKDLRISPHIRDLWSYFRGGPPVRRVLAHPRVEQLAEWALAEQRRNFRRNRHRIIEQRKFGCNREQQIDLRTGSIHLKG